MTHRYEASPENTSKEDDFVSHVAESPFMQALLKMKEKNETVSDRLHELYTRGEEKKDEYDTFVDDIVFEMLASNQEFMDNANAIRTASPEKQIEIKKRQNELFNLYRSELISYAGLPEEAGLNALGQARAKVAEKVRKLLEDGAKQDEILNALDIITVDEDGKEHFHYPQGLFPATTDKKWETYLDSVRNHIRVSRAVTAGTLDQKEGEYADEMRRFAHNAVAQEVDTILGLSELPESKWKFADTRELLAKMRDRRFPTVETSEKGRTTREILEGLDVIKALHTRIADLHKDK